MTTQLHAAAVVDANGLVKACSWCCTREQLQALMRLYPGRVSHGLCPTCEARLLQEIA